MVHATSWIYFAQLVDEESTVTVLLALRKVVEQVGVFCALPHQPRMYTWPGSMSVQVPASQPGSALIPGQRKDVFRFHPKLACYPDVRASDLPVWQPRLARGSLRGSSMPV
jgi:hypothetical protein